MVRLDRRRAGAAARLDHVRVERALHEVPRVPELLRLLLEHADELLADDLALPLRARSTPASRLEEALLGVDRDQRHLEVVAERGHHLVALVLAHQAVVHEHARELVAHRPVHEQRGDRRVDPAGQPADHLAVAHLLADARDLLLDHRGGAPRHVAAADVAQEASRGSCVPYGVCTTSGWNWMPYSPRSVSSIAATGDSVEDASAAKPGGASKTVSRWLIQHDCSSGMSAQQPPVRGHGQVRAPELAHLGALDAPAELEHHRLHPVTDAEHRDAELEQLRAQLRRARRRTPTRARPTGSAPCGRRRSTSSSGTWCGSSSANTPHSRTRRAISCEYWPPKSRTSTSSVAAARRLGRPPRVWTSCVRHYSPTSAGSRRHAVRLRDAAPRPRWRPCRSPCSRWSCLPSRLERGRDHHLGPVEGRDVLVAAGGHRGAQAAHQVEGAVVLVGRAEQDLLERAVLGGLHARAARQRRVEGGHPPVVAAAGRLVGARQRRADHHGVGAAGERLRDVAAVPHAAVGDHLHVLAGLEHVLRAGGRHVGDRGGLRDADAEHAARGAGRARADADEHRPRRRCASGGGRWRRRRSRRRSPAPAPRG